MLDSAELGSIANLKEEEARFPPEELVRSPISSIPPSSAENKAGRATRSQSRAAELAKSPSPIPVDKSGREVSIDEQSVHMNEEHENEEAKSPLPSSRPSQSRIAVDDADDDEDNDELDLIGSSAFSIEGERKPTPVTRVSVKPEERTAVFSGAEPTKITRTSRSPSLSPPPGKTTLDDADEEMLSPPSLPIGKVGSLSPPPPVNLPDDSEQRLPLQDPAPMAPGADSHLSHKSPQEAAGEAIKDSTAMEVDESEEDLVQDVGSVPVKEEEQDDTPRSPKPLNFIRVHIPFPPSIQEKILIPAPVVTPITDAPYNLDDETPSVSELEPSKQSTSKFDAQGHFNPQYTLPPLSTLPVDFVRKAKPSKKKKEKDGKRDKDDGLPMGLNRWGATVMANPVWKKVARANKCLSTREWGVRASPSLFVFQV